MAKIRALAAEVIAKIAAGEVVERPASVVKELVENAIDAGATEIKIEVEGGGSRLIRVTDNGEGMSPEDALLALERYTTSKISTAADLFAVQTFGFRGEALAAMAGVSKMRIVTGRGQGFPDLKSTSWVEPWPSPGKRGPRRGPASRCGTFFSTFRCG